MAEHSRRSKQTPAVSCSVLSTAAPATPETPWGQAQENGLPMQRKTLLASARGSTGPSDLRYTKKATLGGCEGNDGGEGNRTLGAVFDREAPQTCRPRLLQRESPSGSPAHFSERLSSPPDARSRLFTPVKRAGAVVLAAVLLLGIGGCGGVSEETCKQIDWQGSQCEALDQEKAEQTLRRGLRKGLLR